jgi:hypothetical protein
MVAKGDKGPSGDAIRDIIASAGRGVTLDSWMLTNFSVLETELSPRRNLDWDTLASRLSDEGLTNLHGRKLTGHTARRTWWRVRDEVRKARTADARPVPAAIARPVPPAVVREIGPPSADLEPVRERPPPLTLRPARTIAPGEVPQDDGSKLPKPIHRP